MSKNSEELYLISVSLQVNISEKIKITVYCYKIRSWPFILNVFFSYILYCWCSGTWVLTDLEETLPLQVSKAPLECAFHMQANQPTAHTPNHLLFSGSCTPGGDGPLPSSPRARCQTARDSPYRTAHWNYQKKPV